MSTTEGATPAPKKRATSKKDQTPPAPAPILETTAATTAPAVESQAMTSEGMAELPPDRALAYSLHRAALADRLTLLAAVNEEAVLVAVQALLVADGDPALAAEVEERIAVLRRGRADAAGVPAEAVRPVLALSDWRLPVRLTPAEHGAVRTEVVALAQSYLEAEEMEKIRATSEKEKIAEKKTMWRGRHRIAVSGEEIRDVPCETLLRGTRAITTRLDTGEVVEERDASAREIERVSQLPLWRS